MTYSKTKSNFFFSFSLFLFLQRTSHLWRQHNVKAKEKNSMNILANLGLHYIVQRPFIYTRDIWLCLELFSLLVEIFKRERYESIDKVYRKNAVVLSFWILLFVSKRTLLFHKTWIGKKKTLVLRFLAKLWKATEVNVAWLVKRRWLNVKATRGNVPKESLIHIAERFVSRFVILYAFQSFATTHFDCFSRKLSWGKQR